MTKILKPSSSATDYTVQVGDTLLTIATAQCADLGDQGWKAIAQLNWGTLLPPEVLRALTETVGVKKDQVIDPNKPETLLLDPAELKMVSTDALPTPKIKIPAAWKIEGLELFKKHKVKVKPVVMGSCAVSFDKLDPWFIPRAEGCELEFSLGGDGKHASKLQLDVFGSNYCDATDYSNGLGTYSDPAALETEPLYTEDCTARIKVRGTGLKPAAPWKGTTTTTKGMLGRKTGSAKDRSINVAFSPYTVHLRYYKAETDKDAVLLLQPFWPRWTETATTTTVNVDDVTKKATWNNAADATRGALEIKDKDGQRVHLSALVGDELKAGSKNRVWDGKYRADALNSQFGRDWLDADKTYQATITTLVRKPDPATLEIQWKVKGSQAADRLRHGLLQVTDVRGKVVFRKVLTQAVLAKQDEAHKYVWDGKFLPDVKNSKNGDEVIPEDMPYRAQVQAHSAYDPAEGVAVCAMHTEVRLFVHQENVVPKDVLYDPWASTRSLELGLGPLVAGAPGKLPAKTDGTKWFQYKLAEAGFHPGPVTGTAHAHSKLALKEFKRSVPAKGTVAAGSFTRLTIDENEDDPTKTALETLRASDKRSWFGNLTKVQAHHDQPDLTDNEVVQYLPDPAKDMIVWVDDRQYYTSSPPSTPKDDANAQYLAGTFGLDDHRGTFDNGEARVDKDAASIPRPWIPLQVEPTLLSRTKKLTDLPGTVDEKLRGQMRLAIGPLRVDWTFDELPPPIDEIDVSAYDKRFTRSRRYVAWAIAQNKAVHNRPDTGRPATYVNCKEKDGSGNTLGGIRPDTTADYYKAAFGSGGESLAPWTATEVTATESIATVIHEHLSAGQTADTDLFEVHLGRAGVWFHPSRIAGDGYRVRAEVQFKQFGAYKLPNLAALEARYPTPPQVHSARLRLWRKSSLRGYVYWGGAPAPGHWPAYVAGFRKRYRPAYTYFVHEGGAAKTFNVTDVYDPGTVAHATRYKNIINNNVQLALQGVGNMTLKSEFIWPWSTRNDFGWPFPSNPGQNINGYLDDITTGTWRAFRSALLLGLLREIEKKGSLRGHLCVEFVSSPGAFVAIYKCASNHEMLYLRKSGAPSLVGEICNSPGCGLPSTSTGTGYVLAKMNLPAVGIPLGATWLFTDSNEDTWVHEVGHHRHLEHASSGPGAKAALHDSQQNSTVLQVPAAGPVVANQGTAGAVAYEYKFIAYDGTVALSDLSPAGSTATGHATLDATNFNRLTWTAVAGATKYEVYRTATAGTPNTVGLIGSPAGTTLDDKGLAGNGKQPLSPAQDAVKDKQWDRHCTMSYAGCGNPYPASHKEYFCGKCILRHRGWRVTDLGHPGTAVTEPGP